MPNVGQRWIVFKQRNRAAILWFILGLPAAWFIAELCAHFTLIARLPMLFGAALLWGLVFVWLGVRVSRLHCPRCGNLFFGDGGGEQDIRTRIAKNSANRIGYAFVGRCCKCCGLKLYA